MLNQLFWGNLILTPKILDKRKCNNLSISACEFYHLTIKTIDNLRLQCLFCWIDLKLLQSIIWVSSSPIISERFVDLLEIFSQFLSQGNRNLVARVITQNIWFEQNGRISNAKIFPPKSIILKLDDMLILWLAAAQEAKKQSQMIASLQLDAFQSS